MPLAAYRKCVMAGIAAAAIFGLLVSLVWTLFVVIIPRVASLTSSDGSRYFVIAHWHTWSVVTWILLAFAIGFGLQYRRLRKH